MKKAMIGFAGFGGVEIALRQAGFEVVSVEIDPAIAFVSWLNSHNIITADLLEIDPVLYQDYDIFHFSPPCPNFSVAKRGGSESDQDLALARKMCEFVKLGRPRYFTLENVWGYRNSLSWLLIWYTLLECGYGVDGWHLNAADYGVPQSRRRMIVVARRDGRQPTKPFPTHSANPDFFTKPHVGWHEAIEDLIDTLPESEFAPWQRERLPQEMRTFLMMTSNTNLLASDCKPGRGVIEPDEPANTVTANSNQTGVKAFVVGGQYQTSNNEKERVAQNRAADHPIWTITASEHGDTRGYVEGRTVSMTPRCLARFQGFPDWYVLPANRELACRGIGNAVPPAVMGAVLISLGIDHNQ